MLNDLHCVINTQTVKYCGCVIWQIGNSYRYGAFIGTLDECKAKIDSAIAIIDKSII